MKSVAEEADERTHAKGFTMAHGGMLYKFGAHGYVYRWSDTAQQWYKSDMDPEALRHPMVSQILREREEDLM